MALTRHENYERPRVYIAGPITKGDRSHNVCQFMQAHEMLLRAGFAVFNPGMTAQLPWAWEVPHEEWLDNCLPWVEVSDVVVRLPGESVGADMEVRFARAMGVPVQEVVSARHLQILIGLGVFDEYLRSEGQRTETAVCERDATGCV